MWLNSGRLKLINLNITNKIALLGPFYMKTVFKSVRGSLNSCLFQRKQHSVRTPPFINGGVEAFQKMQEGRGLEKRLNKERGNK